MAPFFVVAHLRTGHVGRMAVEGVAVVALVQSHVPSLAEAWNPPAWSLSTEAFFYLTFPLLAPRILAKSRNFAVRLGAASWVFSLALGALYIALAPDGIASPGPATQGTWINLLKYSPLVRLPEFIIGISAGRVFLDQAGRDWVARHGPWLSFVLPAIFVGVIAAGERVPYVLLHDALLAPLFALLVLALAGGTGPVARALGAGAIVALGEASYSLYILHIPVGIWTHKALSLAVGAERAGSDAAAIVKVLVATVASLVCFRFVEVPMRARLKAALVSDDGT
jgi:peptidoglycan/LPS O-acetylase OafA/YrhL